MNDWFFGEYARIRETELLCEARGIRNARADANRRAITVPALFGRPVMTLVGRGISFFRKSLSIRLFTGKPGRQVS